MKKKHDIQTVEVLISCMFQHDYDLLDRINLQSNAIVINQTDNENRRDFIFTDKFGETHKVTWIDTTDRGVSRSRNKALLNASADICIIADDDQIYSDGYAKTLIEYYSKCNSDILTFKLDYPPKYFPDRILKIGYLGALKTNSLQITFRRKKIIENNILFDPMMGSGTGNGAREENKFLFECLRKKLKINYIPYLLAKIIPSQSHWFTGFSEKYFKDRGWSTSRFMGKFFSFLYGVEFALAKYELYRNQISLFEAIKYHWKGMFENR